MKGAVLVVHVQEIGLRVVSEEDVLLAVPVEIRDAGAHAFPQRLGESGFLGYVGKLAIAEVMTQPVWHRLVLRGMAVVLHTG